MYDCATFRSAILAAALSIIMLLSAGSEKVHADALGLYNGFYEIEISGSGISPTGRCPAVPRDTREICQRKNP